MTRGWMGHRGEFDAGDEDDQPEDTECKFCGAINLSWVHTGVRWRLADSHGLHVCKNVATPDDFDEVKL